MIWFRVEQCLPACGQRTQHRGSRDKEIQSYPKGSAVSQSFVATFALPARTCFPLLVLLWCIKCEFVDNVYWVRYVRVFSGLAYPRRSIINPLTPNDHYNGLTAPLTSKRCILYIYSTNIDTEYFKHGIYYPLFFSSKCSLFHNSNVFGSCIIHILYTGCDKI